MEQAGVQGRELLPHGRLVLEQLDGIGERGIVHVIENPREGVLGVRVDALPCLKVTGAFSLVDEVQRTTARGQLFREGVGQHRMERCLHPIER